MAYGQCRNFVCVLKGKIHDDELNALENMGAGSLAAVFASLALCPTELVKCRLQTTNEISLNHTNLIQKRM